MYLTLWSHKFVNDNAEIYRINNNALMNEVNKYKKYGRNALCFRLYYCMKSQRIEEGFRA